MQLLGGYVAIPFLQQETRQSKTLTGGPQIYCTQALQRRG
jgi:hypothetical protein